jgi:hypothetical protein
MVDYQRVCLPMSQLAQKVNLLAFRSFNVLVDFMVRYGTSRDSDPHAHTYRYVFSAPGPANLPLNDVIFYLHQE